MTLIALKDFAVRHGYSVPEMTINEINSLEAVSLVAAVATNYDEKNSSKVDNLAIQLSQITYPVNLSNVRNTDLSKGVTGFVYALLTWGIVASLASGFLIWFIKDGGKEPFSSAGRPLLALFLGMIGAIVYVMLPDGKLNVVVGVDAESRANAVVRVAMGAILGFVIFLAGGLSKTATGGTPPSSSNLEAMELILPFIGGYSITLVVGVLAKVVATIALTFGIDEKSIRSSLQK